MKKFTIISLLISALPVLATNANECSSLPSHKAVTEALKSVVKPTGGESNGGLDLNMWATLVDRSGKVCIVAKSGVHAGDQWPGSRVISAQKANTANAFSLPDLALSTANLWKATQPGGSLYGLQHSNPVDANSAYEGEVKQFGRKDDPLVGKRIGGVNVFGGGVALYDKNGNIVGALGVSGDTSCADHNIAWKLRDKLKYDYVPGGVSESGDDNIIYATGNGFSHVDCGNGEAQIADALATSHPVSKAE